LYFPAAYKCKQGGGLVLKFAIKTQGVDITGVIVNSPLISLGSPPSWLTKLMVTYIGMLLPSKIIPIYAPAEVGDLKLAYRVVAIANH
jgi:alpha-beta hydrolase superfamily lysophospholipase